VQFPKNKKKLLGLLADGLFHSGPELADQLELSRSAIWKIINGLEENGIEIVAVTGKGYCLKQSLELLNKNLLNQYLSTASKNLITTIELHDQIDSTNKYLNDLAQANSVDSAIFCLAERQTAGKGRRGRQWISPFGSNCYFSLLWRFEEGPESLFGLSLAIGVAVIRALKKLGIQGVGLKWPNDIFCQKKKLGGILLEVSGESNGPCAAVIGLGLNLYLSTDAAVEIDQDWTDLNKITSDSINISRNQLLASLMDEMVQVSQDFTKKTFSAYCDEWRSYDCMQGQRVNVFIGQQTIVGVIQGIDDAGLLLLQMDSGEIRHYASGEVSFQRS
jgi:BirA family biotin operon repressor/biotin-[acetyl-CoA-carboxylase] ligase